MWDFVIPRFNAFLSNIDLTLLQRLDGIRKHSGVRKCLNKHYYNSDSDSENSLLIGSWGKHTMIRPPRDIDILFQLPYSTYQRFQARSGNVQSQILQEVKSVLATTYPTTNMRGDGQVVVVPFATYSIEVVPSFLLTDGKYWICDTHDEGRYKTNDPNGEFLDLDTWDKIYSGKLRHLIKMLKCWQSECNVPIKSFFIELLSRDFLIKWEHRFQTIYFYDWMIRDCFAYMYFQAGKLVCVPGTYEYVNVGSNWLSKVHSAYWRANYACNYEKANDYINAGIEWQKIFGNYIQLMVA